MLSAVCDMPQPPQKTSLTKGEYKENLRRGTRHAAFGRYRSNLFVEKRRVDYRSLPTRQWLNRCHSSRVPFTWTINPYRGCEYGCKYCYARFTHEFLELHDPQAFETEIFVKDWDLGSFRKELHKLRAGESIAIGTATDPYQPAERRFGRTRAVLEALTSVQGITIYLTTKSDLAGRDADVLRKLSSRNTVRVAVTVTTVDTHLARLMEPFAPRPDLRLQALAVLASNGIFPGVLASPVLPLITDTMESLSAVARAGKTAGASCFSAGVLFLKPTAQQVFFPFLAEHFPHILGRYRNNYRSGAYIRGEYPEIIARRVARIRQEIGLEARAVTFAPPAPGVPRQLEMF